MQKRTVRRARNNLQALVTLAVFAGIIYAGFTYGPVLYYRIRGSGAEQARADLNKLGEALSSYRVDVGSYPTTDQGLGALTGAPAGATGWRGPYLDKAIYRDPWGHSYVYRSPGNGGNGFDLLSYGADGEPGGQGEDADITYFR